MFSGREELIVQSRNQHIKTCNNDIRLIPSQIISAAGYSV